MVQRVGGGWKAGTYAICEWVCEEHDEIVPAWAANTVAVFSALKKRIYPESESLCPVSVNEGNWF